MATASLGVPLDLHGGGTDLIFPHHECEIAQSESVTGEPFSRHWMHSAMVSYEGEKMSKSLGNLVFVSDLLKTTDARAIRLALMRHHYRAGFEWYDTDLDEGTALLHRLLVAAARPGGPDPRPFAERVRAALDRDLDAPHAVEAIDDLASAVLSGGDDPRAPEVLRELGALLGVPLDRPVEISTGA
jgi:L-cysteine:1D-myo-inositol 2-amino-2-deoxy-alpha-D-glucopyranoside ligase